MRGVECGELRELIRQLQVVETIDEAATSPRSPVDNSPIRLGTYVRGSSLT
jgi:hypothetical protein